MAWLVVLPCALVVVVALVVLGPPLGEAFFAPGSDRFWPEAILVPEPVEHARYVLALLGPPLAAALVVAGAGGRVRLPAALTRAAIVAVQACTLALLALALLAQYDVLFRAHTLAEPRQRMFTPPTLVTAAALALALGELARRPAVVARVTRLARETRAKRVACLLAAAALVAVSLSAAFNTERSVGAAEANHLIPWDMSETFAVLNGRTPLVDFHSQYAQLLPYLAAGALRIFGASVGTWTGTMIAGSGLALLAVYALLRRLVGGSLLALAAFAPFLAASAFLASGRLSSLEVFSVWPMRYGGAYVLAWLTARHLDGVAPRRRWLLLAAGALVAVNNLEFGLPALGGTLAALLAGDPPRSRRAALRLLADVGVGVAAAAALVAAISLAHGGALPDFALLLEFPRLYGVGGWVLDPMPTASLHLAMYATYAAAIVVAAVRAVRGDDGAALTGLLAWSGVFGLGAGSYYVGRSNLLDLVVLFSSWCLALLLLAIVVLRRLAASGHRPLPLQLAVLFGCGLFACALTQLPQPWTEAARVGREVAPIYKQPTALALVRATTRPGERVAILIPLGHRLAYDAGVVDVAPYASSQQMPTADQLERTFDAMRDASARKLYLDDSITYPALLGMAADAGFATTRQAGEYILLTRPASR